ncbi:MAG: nucleotidyl transferase AbiEii/AbiGii toxin family protein [Bacteroidales bacterium]
MKGITPATEEVFKKISVLPFLRDYTLVGGTALSLQIGHRLSEDLDFCIWAKSLRNKRVAEVDWPSIRHELEGIGQLQKMDILGFDQVNFLLDGVKISFFAKGLNRSPVGKTIPSLNHISLAGIGSIGIMKVELLMRRREWKDYYDIYSILKEGVSLKKLVDGARVYSNNLLKTRDALSFLSDSSNYRKNRSFSLLDPVYNVTGKEIEEYIVSRILEEYR